MTQSPFPLTDELRNRVKQILKNNLWEKIEGQPAVSMKTIQTMKLIASIDPVGALEWTGENKLPDQMAMMIRQQAFVAQMETDAEEVFDKVSQIEDPMMRSMVMGLFLRKLPGKHPALAAVENQLVEDSRSIKQPAMRLALRASIAEHYQLTSRPELADKIVAQHIEEAKKLPSGGWSAYPRSLYAALVAESDPKLAEEMITGIGDSSKATRAQSRVAFACCRTNPELAIKLLAMYEADENTITVWRNSIKVAVRMAVEQPKAAQKLAASIEEANQRAWALGLMADRVNDSNPQLAKQLLQQAIDALSDPASEKQDWFPAGQTLAGLLPIAQRIEPSKVRPMIWQAIYKTLPKSRWVSGTSNKVKLQSVAAAIARYDLELGRTLFGKKLLEPGNMFAESAARQALLAPTELPAYAENVLEFDDVRQNRIIENLIVVLSANEQQFWQSTSRPMMLNWPTPGFEEF